MLNSTDVPGTRYQVSDMAQLFTAAAVVRSKDEKEKNLAARPFFF